MKKPEEIRSYTERICGIPQGRLLLRRRDSETVRARRILRVALRLAAYPPSEIARIVGQDASTITQNRKEDDAFVRDTPLYGKCVRLIVEYINGQRDG